MASSISSETQVPTRDGLDGEEDENANTEPKDVDMVDAERVRRSHVEFSRIPVTLNYRLIANTSSDTGQRRFHLLSKDSHREMYRELGSEFRMILQSSFVPSTDALTVSGELTVPFTLRNLFIATEKGFMPIDRLELSLSITASLQSGDLIEFRATPNGGDPIIDQALLDKFESTSISGNVSKVCTLPFQFTLKVQKASAEYGLCLDLEARVNLNVTVVARSFGSTKYSVHSISHRTVWSGDSQTNNKDAFHGKPLIQPDDKPAFPKGHSANQSSKRTQSDNIESISLKRLKRSGSGGSKSISTDMVSMLKQDGLKKADAEAASNSISSHSLRMVVTSSSDSQQVDPVMPVSDNSTVLNAPILCAISSKDGYILPVQNAEFYTPVDHTETIRTAPQNCSATVKEYRRHPKPDGNAPKRPPSAYTLFSNRVRSDALERFELPGYLLVDLIEQRWQHELPTAEKELYQRDADAARRRYDDEVVAYEKTDAYQQYAQYLEDFKGRGIEETTDSVRLDEARQKGRSTPIQDERAEVRSFTTPEGIAPSKHLEALENKTEGVMEMNSEEDVPTILPETEPSTMRSHSSRGSIVTGLKNVFRKLQRRKPLASHHRLQWTCGCGETLFVDINKRSEGEIKRLAAILQCSPGLSPGASNVAMNNLSPQRPPPVAFPQRTSLSPSNSSMGSSTSISLTSMSRTHPASTIASPKQSYLELCINTGEYTKTLSEIDLAHVRCDGELFRRIRSEYLRLRSFRSKIWLLKPSGFTVQNGHRVGILQTPLSIPPRSEVSLKNWTYTPCPLEDDPPMPSDIFLHYLSCTDFDPAPAWLPRLPKKLDMSILRFTGAINEGWGIHIKEGPNWATLGWVNAAVLMGSGVAAGLWSWFVGDFQGAMGFAGWIVAVVNAVMVAWIARWSQF